MSKKRNRSRPAAENFARVLEDAVTIENMVHVTLRASAPGKGSARRALRYFGEKKEMKTKC